MAEFPAAAARVRTEKCAVIDWDGHRTEDTTDGVASADHEAEGGSTGSGTDSGDPGIPRCPGSQEPGWSGPDTRTIHGAPQTAALSVKFLERESDLQGPGSVAERCSHRFAGVVHTGDILEAGHKAIPHRVGGGVEAEEVDRGRHTASPGHSSNVDTWRAPGRTLVLAPRRV